MTALQKSKLIIFFMTKTPIDIQTTQQSHHHAAERLGPKQLDVARAREIDEDHHRERQASR